MGKGIEYTVKSFVRIDGQPYEFDKLDEKTRSSYARKMLDNMSRTLSTYCSDHPDELEKLMNTPGVEVIR